MNNSNDLVAPDHVKTMNRMGNMVLRPNPALTAFFDCVEKTQGYFADIGSAYGSSTLQALRGGGHVTAIDLDQRHLDILLKKCPLVHASRLEVECGHFPNTISLPSNTYDGILLSRVLIFLTQDEIDLALTHIYQALKPGGVAYITSPSPFRKKWEALLPIYEKQKLESSLWPGKIDDLWSVFPHERERLPNTLQLIDVPSLKKGLGRAGFHVEVCDYYPTTESPHIEAFELTYAIASKRL